MVKRTEPESFIVRLEVEAELVCGSGFRHNKLGAMSVRPASFARLGATDGGSDGVKCGIISFNCSSVQLFRADPPARGRRGRPNLRLGALGGLSLLLLGFLPIRTFRGQRCS